MNPSQENCLQRKWFSCGRQGTTTRGTSDYALFREEKERFLCKENPRIVRGFSISFSGDFPKTKQKTSHDIEYGNAVCKLPYQFIYLGGFLHEIKRVLSK